jgi:uncharacterized protein YceH (UPF0502 family)
MADEEKKPAWPVLDANERRVLGVLIEKAKTTPDSYPLSVNAVVTGCNQKSNREPVMSLNDLEVEDTLSRLQRKGLVTRVTGTRVDRFRHELYDAWKLDKVDSAIVCELLLRGPQTEGELRTHASRMQSFDDLDALRAALKPLTERGLVVYLSPQGKRGTTLTHGFHAPAELERLRQKANSDEAASASPASPSTSANLVAEWEQRWQQAQAEVGRLSQELTQTRAALAELQQTIASLSEEVRTIKQGLGM